MDQLILPLDTSSHEPHNTSGFDTRFSAFDPFSLANGETSISDCSETTSFSTEAPSTIPPPCLDNPPAQPGSAAQFKIGQAGSITVNLIFYNDGKLTSASSGAGASAPNDWWKSYVEDILSSFKVMSNSGSTNRQKQETDCSDGGSSKVGKGCHVVVSQQESTTVNIQVQSTDDSGFYAKYNHEIRWLVSFLLFVVICIIIRVFLYI